MKIHPESYLVPPKNKGEVVKQVRGSKATGEVAVQCRGSSTKTHLFHYLALSPLPRSISTTSILPHYLDFK